jgi:membrane-bound lytic murein transglycosylase D
MNRTTIPALLALALALPARAEDPPTPATTPVEEAAPVLAEARIESAAVATGDLAEDPPADAPDDAVIEEKVAEESAALEQLHAAEQDANLLGDEAPGRGAADAASRLGFESPLRQRLGEAFGRDRSAGGDAGEIPGLREIDHDLRRLQAEYDIPIDVNDAVVAYVRFFQSPRVRPHFVRWLSRSSKYIPRFREILREEGLPEDTVYLAMIESGFSNLAASHAKAVGAWQFIPSTGKRMGLDQDFWIDERRDPEKAARSAARYLKDLYRTTGDWRLAWASYNAGPGKVARAIRTAGSRDFWVLARGRVLKAETKGYVPKLMAAAIVAKHPEAFGFGAEVVPEAWTAYEEVLVPRATELSFLAAAAEVPEEALLQLNPELRRTCTPPRSYALKVPLGRAEAFARNWPELEQRAARTAIARHKVIRGETLTAIAHAYGVSSTAVAKLNGLKPGRRVKPGTVLVVPLGSLARRDAEALAAKAPKWREEPVRVAKVSKPAHGKAAKRVAAAAAAGTVRVRSGDTLWSLAKRFGVAVHELARWNGIANPSKHKLQAGQSLVVRPRATAPTGARKGTVSARAG